jgi:hypothetical protein
LLLLEYAPPLQVNVNISLPAALGVTVNVPLKAFVPLHAPLAVQLAPAVTDHVMVAGCPTTTAVGCTLIVIGVAGFGEPPPP